MVRNAAAVDAYVDMKVPLCRLCGKTQPAERYSYLREASALSVLPRWAIPGPQRVERASGTDLALFYYLYFTADERVPGAHIKSMSVSCYKAVRVESPESLAPGLNINEYCFLHSGQYAKITGQKKCGSDNNDPDLYLSVKSPRRTIYLKYHAGRNSGDTVALSYNNLFRLRLLQPGEDSATVSIAKSNSFMYMWMNGDATGRHTFRLAVVGTVTGIAGIICALL